LAIHAPRSFEKAVSPGEIALAWLNSHSSILLMTSRATLVIDPVGVMLPEHVRPDAVVVTHSHIDHLDRTLLTRWQEKLGMPIIASAFVAGRLLHKPKVIQEGDRVSVGDIDLLAERCDHHATQPLSFVILAKGAPTIYHPSDSEPFADMARLGDEYKPQVMLYNGSSMTKAAIIAKLVRPRMIVSCCCDAQWGRDFLQHVSNQAPQTSVRFVKPLEIIRFR
jgi:L-ascorbate metabolism protein UlaG (beta-lactamase superfamily)